MPRPKKLRNAKVVPLVLEGELYEQAKRIAAQLGVSVSEYVRQALKEKIEADSVRLGLSNVFEEKAVAQARDGSLTAEVAGVPPLAVAQFNDFARSWEELRPALAKAVDEVKMLWGEWQGLDEEARHYAEKEVPPHLHDKWVKVEGRGEMWGRQAFQAFVEEYKAKRMKELAGRLREVDAVISRYWKLYYVWMKLRKEVFRDDNKDKEMLSRAAKIEAELARMYERIAEVRKEREELRRALYGSQKKGRRGFSTARRQ
ncbi:hypothetical protein [Thermofilum pendens]|uniref:Uncharacterized protein n=1 Tax=Thermofilum pendens (strain DSM 2475 / Hrk 5) TaxID=368408 RepID=A1S1B7_THEPD|nr:hypothetical protein [Thermofilum pendens]ABL79247.1 hypothetical protein Tpen_1852 [Thermofilum pendens Hrk 5]